jgi:hypothetical protein
MTHPANKNNSPVTECDARVIGELAFSTSDSLPEWFKGV